MPFPAIASGEHRAASFRSSARILGLLAADNLPVLLLAGLMELSHIRLSLLCLAAAAVALQVVLRSSGERLSLLDLSVLLFLTSVSISTWFALYKPAAIMQLALCVCASLLYLGIRVYRGGLLLLLSALALIATAYCTRGFAYFTRSYHAWRGLQFDHLVDFRAYATLTPRGARPGNPDAVYLLSLAACLAGFALARRRGWRARLLVFLAPTGLALVSILLSFSRGMYLAAFAGTVVLFFWLGRKQRAMALGGLFAVALALAAAARHSPIAAAIADTVEMNATISQQLSARSRGSQDLVGLRVAQRAPWAGVGPGNFALGIHVFSLHRDATVVSEPFNLFIGVAAEQGVIGLLALVLIAVALTRAIAREARGPEGQLGLVLGGGFAALLVYSLAQPFLLSSSSAAAASYAWLGIVARLDANASC